MSEPDYNEIPAFLARQFNGFYGSTDPSDDKDGSPAARERHGLSPVTAPAESNWRQLHPLTERDKQVIAELESKTQASAKDESYARIGKLKASKADRAAVAAGKTWDAINGGWK